ncbi:glycerol-3-phosphate 1-O-acyltransferase PlsY [Phaeovulum sp.]|uniref:glycerol-3-phosphate 1-O-acyltransferase PlsY n=1 Tax=Phaeovulum sp. TaxID=2934796 RepID=UPI00273126FB|nr:glycerol-3-phosphate 1-O-acyltransferase PlsY [Phaeovulum sp.]MDP1669292.1 glycerol-3-phosphate 1-O-acyltransferase PlsY [Phaeovulum sp.]MDZ4119568.1 glycerol-3-phosphate 1-O-acyltransferase PlsY [Phaeovulum sp.]
MPGLESGAGALALAALLGYLLGAIPFGVVITWALGLADPRSIGSGNIGATNVLRTGNKGAALATLLLDGGKGAAAVLIARALYPEDAVQLAAAAAFLGHLYPVWLGFKGGKGVATFLGISLALAWPVGVSVCAVWLVMALGSRISSLAALVAAATSVTFAWIYDRPDVMMLCAVLAALVFWRHRANIARLAAGTEPRIGGKH